MPSPSGSSGAGHGWVIPDRHQRKCKGEGEIAVSRRVSVRDLQKNGSAPQSSLLIRSRWSRRPPSAASEQCELTRRRRDDDACHIGMIEVRAGYAELAEIILRSRRLARWPGPCTPWPGSRGRHV